MLRIVKYIDYEANYAYSPPEAEAVINTEEIVAVTAIQREYTRRPFDDICRIRLKDGTWMDVIGKPSDFIEIRSGN